MNPVSHRAYQITKDQIHDLKYLHYEQIVGLIGVVCGAHSIPITKQSLAGIKRAVEDYFGDGCELEWENYEVWKWWEHLSPEWFELVPSTNLYNKELPCAPSIKCNKKPSDFKKDHIPVNV
jgi:hypothetical protein